MMKNFSSLIAFIFVLFIALGINTRGTHGTRVCLVPLEYNVPCETSDCNSRCLYKFGVKAPGPGVLELFDVDEGEDVVLATDIDYHNEPYLVTVVASTEDDERLTFMSDMQKELIGFVGDLLSKAQHRWCARHIEANWSKS
ncbi:hypothetical protein MTR67_050953 [Solanum verrucosum]|uniref:Uncharacterized protein n=1 Tax=Solanum verrucosum TaxID=315347 RepID=A0AAF0V6E6_SOLVR|nr:hypothetical protein MTR67_050953 [Solanum verrucosum]